MKIVEDKLNGKTIEELDKVGDNITFQEAVGVIKASWGEKETKDVSDAISNLYKERAEVLLIVGIPNDNKDLKREVKTEEQKKEEDERKADEEYRNSLTEEELRKVDQKLLKEERDLQATQTREEKEADEKAKKEKNSKYFEEKNRTLSDDEKKKAIEIRNKRYLDEY